MKIPQSILILAALKQEEEALVEKLKSKVGSQSVERINLSSSLGLEMSRVKIDGRSISVVRTGIGAVNAAVALMLGHAHSAVDSVVLLGVGGALRGSLDVGDLVISTRVLQHDYFYSFDHGDTRIRPGALILSSDEAQGHSPEFMADPDLVAWVKNAESHADLKTQILEGSILSGSEFVGRVDRKRSIAQLLPDALLVEMEAAGVAQIAEKLGIPFVVAKTVADRLNPDGSIESDFRACLDAAATHAAAALHSLF